ncbi:pollen Ole e 1 allergen and extensin family protein [Tasmannia lanceolata]|uniref:pollen Ole e 1 allergen and extensin family protein n=1 Tax=Tasmannia lanceolata TaxID=3420 RepID=UPI004062DF2B
MALPSVMMVLLFALFLVRVDVSMSHVVKGSVSCLDCSHHHLPGVRVAVKCGQEKRMEYALTDEEGSFEAKLPLSASSTPLNCFAMLLGGPQKLCSYKKTLVSKIVKAQDSDSYTISTPFTVFSKCPSETSKSISDKPGIKSSKIFDLPVPPEWGLAPTSYYFPFFPIIGIP